MQLAAIEVGVEKFAHVMHTLVDRVGHPTEGDRLGLHELVSEITGIFAHQAADAVADPVAYAKAEAAGAYIPVEPAAPPPDPRDAQIAALQAQLDAARATAAEPAAPTMTAAELEAALAQARADELARAQAIVAANNAATAAAAAAPAPAAPAAPGADGAT